MLFSGMQSPVIRLIDPSAAHLLRSSVVISSFAKAVQGMVCWLLGASGCTSISVDMSLQTHTIIVSSNIGLSAAELVSTNQRREKKKKKTNKSLESFKLFS